MKSEPKPSTIDIDKIFDEGREPTEEEWKIWATNFKPKKLKRRTETSQITTSVKKAKVRAKKQDIDRKSYNAFKEGKERKSWGNKYNQKRKYLYKYNKEWKANLQNTQAVYQYSIDNKAYDSWRGLYFRKYRYNITEYASTFKISENVYVYGFTKKQLIDIGPFSQQTTERLLKELVFPEPEMEGYIFKDKAISKKPVKFYLLTEAFVYFNFWCQHTRKIKNLSDPKNQLYIKKKLWEAMLAAREDFKNEQ